MTALCRMPRIVCLSISVQLGLLLCGRVQAGSEPEIHDVVKSWQAAAQSIQSFEIQIRGKDVRPAADVRDAQVPIEDQAAEVTFDFEIGYLLKRPDGERFTRRGLLPSNVGMRQFRRTRVLADDHARSLDEGGGDSHFPYDQYKLEDRAPIREPVLQPIRILLNIAASGQGPFLDGHDFQLVDQNAQPVDGAECLLAESAKKRGARIWFEHSKPYRIRKIELEHLVADRSGHLEYLYRFHSAGTSDRTHAEPSGASFEFPSGWEITVFAPDRKIRAQMQCDVVSATSNAPLASTAFDLPVPPGAIIVDDRQHPSTYSLQLADGTTRPIAMNELGVENLFRLSATVAGSRIENQTLKGPATIDPGRGWLVIANVIAVLMIVGIYRIRRRLSRVE